jgi:YesN/AraC family two-component response regulator
MRMRFGNSSMCNIVYSSAHWGLPGQTEGELDQGKHATVKPIRVLIADDRLRSREGLRALLDTCEEIEVIGEASNGEEAVRMAEENCPDVVLMDVRMPVMGGVEATRLIKEKSPGVQVVILSLYTAYRISALAAGAVAFLVKGGPSDELLETIKTWGATSEHTDVNAPLLLPS